MALTTLAKALFDPASIALIGASANPDKNTARPQRFLRKYGYAGAVFPINPNRRQVLDEPAYPSLAALAEPVEHAYIMTPAASVPRAFADCCAAGITVATVFSDGFGETGGAGRDLQNAILKTARAAGLRLLGPNSIGLINTQRRLALTVNAVLERVELRTGSISLVSQSGSLIGTLLSRGQARGIGFAKLISVGNEADLSVGEIVDLLAEDPHTETILLFLETVRDAETLGQAARRAYAAGKPVIVYKLGRSALGARLALSHTGAIAGDDELADAFFRQHGMLRVDGLETLFELPALLKARRPPRKRCAAVLTTTGGGAAMVVDRLGAAAIECIAAPATVREKLAAFGLRVDDAPLIDLTLAGARGEVYASILNALLESPECGAVIAVVGSSGLARPELAVAPIIAAARSDKAIAAFVAPQAEQSLRLFAQAGVAAFRTPEACADGVRAYLRWTPPAAPAAPAEAKRLDGVRQALAAAGGTPNEWQARRVFAALGIAQANAEVVQDPRQGTALDYPLAVKVLSSAIVHKSDVGGVRLGVTDETGLRLAIRQVLDDTRRARPDAVIDGVLLQSMEQGLAQALIGYRRSALGPTVTLAAGGVLAELYRDAVVRMAPVDRASAMAMIGEVKGLALLRGYRNHRQGDLDALAQALCALSQLAYFDEIEEAEINPLIVKAAGQGVVAVDGLLLRST